MQQLLHCNAIEVNTNHKERWTIFPTHPVSSFPCLQGLRDSARLSRYAGRSLASLAFAAVKAFEVKHVLKPVAWFFFFVLKPLKHFMVVFEVFTI